MEVTLRSTTKVVEFEIDGAKVPARIWEGATASGIPCHAYITRIACLDQPQHTAEFDRELQHHRPPSAAIAAIPIRLIL